MTQYLDTSLLVSAVANEPRSAKSRAWFERQKPDGFVISDWVVAEFSAALSIKLRTGALTVSQRSTALEIFGRLIEQSLKILPVESRHFRAAARLADQFALGLRAGDALHLAIAVGHSATICTLDRRLAEAAGSLGINAELI